MSNQTKKNKVVDEDSSIINAINAGQMNLMHTLVEKYSGRLFNFGLKMCNDAQDAEDLVQDTFLNVMRYLKEFRFETKFRNWLYRVATSVCIKKRRRSKFAPERELSLEEFAANESKTASDSPPDWAGQPLEKILNLELAETLKDAIVKLPEKYRLVLVLRDMEGFSTAEAAQILNLSETNVKVRLHRARLFLREELKGYYEDGQKQT